MTSIHLKDIKYFLHREPACDTYTDYPHNVNELMLYIIYTLNSKVIFGALVSK